MSVSICLIRCTFSPFVFRSNSTIISMICIQWNAECRSIGTVWHFLAHDLSIKNSTIIFVVPNLDCVPRSWPVFFRYTCTVSCTYRAHQRSSSSCSNLKKQHKSRFSGRSQFGQSIIFARSCDTYRTPVELDLFPVRDARIAEGNATRLWTFSKFSNYRKIW